MSNFKVDSGSKEKIALHNENSKSFSNNDSGKNTGSNLKASTEEIKSRRTENSITENYWAKKLNRIVDRSLTNVRDNSGVQAQAVTLFKDDEGGGGTTSTTKPFMTKAEYERQAAQDPRLQIPEATGNSYEDAQTVGRWLADAPPEMRGEMLHRVLEDGLKTDNPGDGFAFLANLNEVSDAGQQSAVTDAFDRAAAQSPTEFSNQLKNLAVRLGGENVVSPELIGLTYAIGETGNQNLISAYSKGLLEGARDNDLPFLANMAAAGLTGLDDANLRSFVNNNPNLMTTLVEMSVNQSNRTGVNSGNDVAGLLDRLTNYSQTPGEGEKKLFLAIFNSGSATGRDYGEMRDAVKNFLNKFPGSAISALRTLPNGADGNFLSVSVMDRLSRLGAVPTFDPRDLGEIADWLKTQPAAVKAEYMNWVMSSEDNRDILKSYTSGLTTDQKQSFADALNAAYEKDPAKISGRIGELINGSSFPATGSIGDGFSEIVALTKNNDLILGYVEENLNQNAGTPFGQQAHVNAGTALTGLTTSEFQAFLKSHATNQSGTTPYDYKIQNLVAQLSSPAYGGDALGKLLNTISDSRTEYDYYDTSRSGPVFRVSNEGLNFFELAVKNAGNNNNPSTTDGIVNFFAENPSAVANWAGTDTDNQNTLTTFFQNYVLNHDPKDVNDPITQKIFGTYQGEVNGVPVYSGGALNSLFTDLKTRIARTSDPAEISKYGYQMGVVLGSMVKASELSQENSDNARQLAADRWGAVAAFLSSPISVPVKGVGFGVSDIIGQIAKESYLALNDPSSIEDFGKTFKQEFFNRLQEKLNSLSGKEEEFRALETFFDAIDRGYNAVND